MPIFEYVCRDCGRAFEALVNGSNGSRAAQCPGCHSEALEKQLSVFAVSTATPRRDGPMPPSGGCGRCGDPHGPCSMN
ncbi:MAG: zinc ribbon domain-containing protein [Acidobacteria bacterium]|nr:zinc ribbon domain-containing protein [Acidobacteriota bacterium]